MSEHRSLWLPVYDDFILHASDITIPGFTCRSFIIAHQSFIYIYIYHLDMTFCRLPRLRQSVYNTCPLSLHLLWLHLLSGILHCLLHTMLISSQSGQLPPFHTRSTVHAGSYRSSFCLVWYVVVLRTVSIRMIIVYSVSFRTTEMINSFQLPPSRYPPFRRVRAPLLDSSRPAVLPNGFGIRSVSTETAGIGVQFELYCLI